MQKIQLPKLIKIGEQPQPNIKNYIPKNQRKKILMLSDDIRTHSGVGNMAKEIILNSAHHFNWLNLGGAVKHPDAGKAFDISADVNKMAGLKDSDVKVVACNGYGDQA